MLEKFKKIEERHAQLEQMLGDQQVLADKVQYQKIAREFADLNPAIEILRVLRENIRQTEELEHLLKEKHP